MVSCGVFRTGLTDWFYQKRKNALLFLGSHLGLLSRGFRGICSCFCWKCIFDG